MIKDSLHTMLVMLTGAYVRRDVQNTKKGRPVETNIGRLFSLYSWGLEQIDHQSEMIRLWDDIDNAQGSVLDRYGMNIGVARDGLNDVFYRLLIRIKMIALLSGGDIDTVVQAVSSMFDMDPECIKLTENFPAKIRVDIPKDKVTDEQMQALPIIAKLIKRILASGIGLLLAVWSETEIQDELYVGTAYFETTCESIHFDTWDVTEFEGEARAVYGFAYFEESVESIYFGGVVA